MSTEAYHLLNKAIQQYERENYETAIALVDEAILISPELPELHYWRGKLAVLDLNQESLEVAIVELSEAIRNKPDYAEAYFERGKVYIQKGEYEEAKKDLEETIRLNPKIKEAYSLLAQIYLKEGNDEKAMEYLNKITDKKGDERYYFSLGKILYNAGKYKEAIDYFDKTIQENKYFVDAYVLKAHSLANIGRYAEAIENLRKAAILVPEEKQYFLDIAKYHFELAKQKAKEGNIIESADNFIEGLKIDYDLVIEPEYVEILEKAAIESIKNKNYKKAVEYIDYLERLAKNEQFSPMLEEIEKTKKEVLNALPLKEKLIKFINDLYTK